MLKVKKVNYEKESYGGCETCDYGSKYISNIEIDLEDYGLLKIETNQMYNYMLTESDFMQLLGNSKDIKDLYKNMFNIIQDKSYEIEHRVSLKSMEMKINGNEIDIIKSCELGKLVKKCEKENK